MQNSILNISRKGTQRWRYSAINQAVAPTGWRIYIDSGSGFNFGLPDATELASVEATRAVSSEPTWLSSALSHGQTYKFCVRSYNSDHGETQNTDFVSITADAVGPAAITDLRSSYQEIP